MKTNTIAVILSSAQLIESAVELENVHPRLTENAEIATMRVLPDNLA